MSSKAMDKNKDPENVMAMLMMEPYLKHFMPEMSLPNSMTSVKNRIMRMILMVVYRSMSFIINDGIIKFDMMASIIFKN